ncbi:MAG: MFS transporter [Candidatus Hodarchaeota archaeon]
MAEEKDSSRDRIITTSKIGTVTQILGVPSIFTSTWKTLTRPITLLKAMIGWGLFSVGVSLVTVWESFYLEEYMQTQANLATDAFGIVIAVGGLTYIVAAILAGIFSDSIRTPLGQRIPFIILAAICAGIVLFGAFPILTYFQLGLIGFCVVVGIVHFFLGVGASPWNAILSDLFTKKNRSWAALINSVCSAAGFGIGLVGFELISSFSPNVPWIVCGIGLILAGFLSAIILALSGAAVNPEFRGIPLWTNIKSFFHTIRNFGGIEFGKMFWVITVWGFCNYTLDYYLFLYLTELTADFTQEIDILLYALIGLAFAALLGAAPSGWLAAKIGKARTGIIAALLNAAFFVTLGLLAFLTSYPYFALIMGIFGGLGMTFLTTIIVALPADLVPEGKEAMFFGIVRVAEALPLPFAVIFAGFVVRIVNDFILTNMQSYVGYSIVFILESLVWIFSIVLLRKLRYEDQSDEEYDEYSKRWLKGREDR